jgi:hypothetical protein
MGAVPLPRHAPSMGNWTGSIHPASLQDLTHRVGDSLSHLYYNASSVGSAKVRGWLNAVPQVNTSALTHGLSDKAGAALKSVKELSGAGAREVASLGERGVRSFRGVAGLLKTGVGTGTNTPEREGQQS